MQGNPRLRMRRQCGEVARVYIRMTCGLIFIMAVLGCDSKQRDTLQSHYQNEPRPEAAPEPTPTKSETVSLGVSDPGLGVNSVSGTEGLFDELRHDVVDTSTLKTQGIVATFSFTGSSESREIGRNATDAFITFIEGPARRLKAEWATPGASVGVIRCKEKEFVVYFRMIVFVDKKNGNSFGWKSTLSEYIAEAVERGDLGAAADGAGRYFSESIARRSGNDKEHADSKTD